MEYKILTVSHVVGGPNKECLAWLRTKNIEFKERAILKDHKLYDEWTLWDEQRAMQFKLRFG